MNQHNNLILLALQHKISQIINDQSLSWWDKYNMIFSPSISEKIFSITYFDYYTSDSSYEDDVNTFYRSFSEHVSKIDIDMDLLFPFVNQQ